MRDERRLQGCADHDGVRRTSRRDGYGCAWLTWARWRLWRAAPRITRLSVLFRESNLRWQAAVSQATEVGVRALPILSLITFFIGLILALQSAYELRKLGALSYVASAVAISVTRELGPLITAILVIGRSGSAFAAEIGTMRVTEEIDALETMAIEPVDFLVAPKFLAMIVMMPCLTMWANAMGILGGSLFGVAQADFTWVRYMRSSLDALFLRDIVDRPDQERDVWHYNYGGGLLRRAFHRRRSRGNWAIDDAGRGHLHFHGDCRGSRLHGAFFLCRRTVGEPGS